MDKAHAVADRLEKRLERELAPAQAVIHVDPYDPHRVAHQPTDSQERVKAI